MKSIINSSLLKTSGIYTIANIINSAIPFLLLPILTTCLSPGDYGIVSMFTVLLSVFMPIVSLNIFTSVTRKYYDKDKRFNIYLSTAFVLLIISTFIVSMFVIVFSDSISKFTSFPEQSLYLIIVAAFGNSLVSITLSLWQVREKAFFYGLFQVLQTLMNLVLSIVFVVSLGMNWQGRVNAQVIAITIFAVVGLIIIIKREKPSLKYDKSYAKDIISYGVPLIPHTIGMVLINMTDRIFITNMVGIEATGVYTVGFQIGMIIMVLQDSFNKAWTPYLFKKLNEVNLRIKKNIVKITYLYFALIILSALVLSAITPIIVRVFIGDSFAESVHYVFWIALGFAFNGMYKMVSGVIFYNKKTHILSYITFITAMVNVVLNYILIKVNGTIGASQATFLAFFISFILTWIIANKVYPMPWSIFKKERIT